MAIRLPCSGHFANEEMRSKHPDLTPVECPKFEKKTAEDIAKERADIKMLTERMTKIAPWISAKKRERKLDTVLTDKCPICSAAIQYHVASDNGHMHARCETADCVNFME